jgi:hypothetical protein
MTGKSLNHLSDIAEQVENTTGVMSPILRIDPTDGTLLTFLNRVDVGTAEGLPLFFKLYSDAAGTTELPNDTEVQLLAKRPEDSRLRPVSVVEDSLSVWRENSISQQRNEEIIDQTKLELQSPDGQDAARVNVRDVDEFAVAVRSSAQIDWTESELYFYRGGVEEKQR